MTDKFNHKLWGEETLVYEILYDATHEQFQTST